MSLTDVSASEFQFVDCYNILDYLMVSYVDKSMVLWVVGGISSF